jgi:hypothetical protein
VALRLPRHLGSLRDLDVGQYLVDEPTPTRVREVHVRCPLCGETTLLDPESYVVAGDGRVTPAFRCVSCPLIEWLELDSWPAVNDWNWPDEWPARVLRIAFGVYLIVMLAGLYRGKRR